MYHEAMGHDANSFITLTYDDAHLPLDGSISKRAMQLFWKRLRKATGAKIRYFCCGEYGDDKGRPHYHAIIFGWDFSSDRYLWANRRGRPTYRSPTLELVWPYGSSEIGTVTPASAGYCARYCLKKITGKPAEAYYGRPHPVTGEIFQVMPEFATMSSKPGLGGAWFDQFESDAFPSDFVIVDGSKRPVPPYYTRKLAEKELLAVQWKRKAAARTPQRQADSTPERLETREELQLLRAKQLKREVDDQ